MENSSSSDDPKKAKEPSDVASKKAKGRKSPSRKIRDLANKYASLSSKFYPYEDILRKASFAYDLERQLSHVPDVTRIMEESMRI